MSSSDNGQLLGVVLLARHGDRSGFYQDPNSYTPFGTVITPTGTEEESHLGGFLRQRYLNASSPNFIQNISQTLADINQIKVRADAGGEAGVIYDSSIALLQGLYPATPSYNETLANGTVIVGANNGYQFIPVESVEPNNDVSLEGWTSCGPFNDATNAFYASPEFQAKANESSAFLNSIKQYMDGRPVTLQNMWNIYDFMNVQSIHNATFANLVPPAAIAEARDLANWHEYGVFSDPNLGGIRNIAGRTILPSIIGGLENVANASNPLKIFYQSISYKPFLSLFNMTGVAQAHPERAGIVNYAAVAAFEVRSSSNGPVIRFNFKNGTFENDFTTYQLFGASGDLPLSTFVERLSDVTIKDISQWCSVCQNTNDRGCDQLTLAADQAINSETLHPVGAGLLGAGMAVAFMIVLYLLAYFVGFVQCGKKAKRTQRGGSDSGSDVAKV